MGTVLNGAEEGMVLVTLDRAVREEIIKVTAQSHFETRKKLKDSKEYY